MIKCCNGCPARRLRCHGWGECVHYMNEIALLEQRKEERAVRIAGYYGPADSYRNNARMREKFKKKG